MGQQTYKVSNCWTTKISPKGFEMGCKIEGCDGRHCRRCGRHIPKEMPFTSICDACLIDDESKIAKRLYGNGTDDRRQEAMKMWDI